LQNSAKSNPIDTRAEVAKIAGVSHDTIARGELALKRKHIIAAKARENQGRRTDLNLLENSPKSKPIDTRAEVAKIAGVSDNTIARVEKIVQKAPEEVKENQAQYFGNQYQSGLLENSPKVHPINTRAPPPGEWQEGPTQ
jgi:DNA-binding XRE family transcriptional regulator